MNISNDRRAPSPVVSVLVPSYNAQAYLAECLESVLNQSYPSIEIIVVDDGSTDESLAVARSFESRGIRVIAQENRGPCSARNMAFYASRGDYLQYLDADDVLHAQKIEFQMERLQRAEPTAMASGAWGRFRSSVTDAVFIPGEVWKDLDPVDWLVTSWSGGGMMHSAGWLIPRQIVVSAGPWVESLRWAANDDADFFTRALLASTRCLFCADAKSYYRAVQGSQSTLSTRRSLEAALHVVINTGEALLQTENSERTRSAYADSLQSFVYSTYPESEDLVSRAENRILELGGSSLGASGFLGPVSLASAKLMGWKSSKRLRRLARRVLGI